MAKEQGSLQNQYISVPLDSPVTSPEHTSSNVIQKNNCGRRLERDDTEEQMLSINLEFNDVNANNQFNIEPNTKEQK